MYWLEVSVVTDGEGAEAVSEVLRPFAHEGGVVLEQLGDTENPAPGALEPAITVKIFISEENDTLELRHRIEVILYHLGRLYPLPPPTFQKLQEQDWANAWREHYRPFRVGERILIRPSWSEPQETEPQLGLRQTAESIVLVLDPGMAFGTGLHPTTQMCLEALVREVRPGVSVLDVGTGSGILAIAAAKLGANRVQGVDVDELAIKAAIANVAQNDVSHSVTIQKGKLETVLQRDWDIVVVNILAPVIVDLLDTGELVDYLSADGRLILSGIIDQQLPDVEEAVGRACGRIVDTIALGEWIALVVQRAVT